MENVQRIELAWLNRKVFLFSERAICRTEERLLKGNYGPVSNVTMKAILGFSSRWQTALFPAVDGVLWFPSEATNMDME